MTVTDYARKGRANTNPLDIKRGTRPSTAYRESRFPAQLRGEYIGTGSKQFYEVSGYATVFDYTYKMWDQFGEYKESVDPGSLTKTLAANPDVAFLTNHKGISMARTRSSTPTLWLNSDGLGLHIRAKLNLDRQDVKDLAIAVDDETIDEMSFAFLITEGAWNDDYTEFRILEVDLDRGDVSAVNFGANPYTSIGASVSSTLAAIDAITEPTERERWLRTASVQMLRTTASKLSDADYEEIVKLGRIRSEVDKAAERWGSVGEYARRWDADDG